jgi:hypothetical protein
MSEKGLVGSLLLQVKFIFSRKQWAFGVSILIRVLLLLWGYWQDENCKLRTEYDDSEKEEEARKRPSHLVLIFLLSFSSGEVHRYRL